MNGAGTRIRGSVTLRITRPASWQQDEGIVQPISKDVDQLSRRLHQPADPDSTSGSFFIPKDSWMSAYRTCHPLAAPEAAYIADLIDGEGTITLA